MSDLLVVVDDIAHVVAAVVVSLSHAHGVVGEVDIAVVAEEFRHLAAVRPLRSLVFVFGPVSTCVRSWLVGWLRGKLAWLGWLAGERGGRVCGWIRRGSANRSSKVES